MHPHPEPAKEKVKPNEKIEVPAKAPDLRNTVIAVEYDSPIAADPNAKGKYHWYTTRSKRNTEIRTNPHAGKTKLLDAVEGE